MQNALLTYNPESQGAEGDLLLFGVPVHRPQKNLSTEFEELELASAFLDARNATELDNVVRRTLRRGEILAGRPLGSSLASELGSRIAHVGRSIRQVLNPSAIHRDSDVASEVMERIIGAELEGLSGEDQEFETARYFVRFALEATRAAAMAPKTSSPTAIAAAAQHVAARRYTPGLWPHTGFRARRAIRRQLQQPVNQGDHHARY